MAPLRPLLLAAALFAACPARAESVADWGPFVAEASLRFGVPVPWIERAMQVESAGRTTIAGRPVVSPTGAMGLMQLMPTTWRALQKRLGLGADPFDPHDNILAGTFYLRLMYDRFGYPGLFAAYNAGPGRYAAYVAGRKGLPRETRAYLASVVGRTGGPRTEIARRLPAPLFAVVAAPQDQETPGGERPEPRALFAIPLGR